MRRPGLVLAAFLVVAPITGCGVDLAKEGTTSSNATTVTATRSASQPALPARPPGAVEIDGGREDVLTKSVVSAFSGRFATRASVRDSGGETQGFQDLCAGRVDVVDATRSVSGAEAATCRANGLTLTNPIVVGSDALVVATKNESDVGGDCVTVAQVRDIYRAGSPITNWNQLSFDDLNVRASGRAPGTDIFDFFAFQVLGVENGATLSEVRGDYLSEPTDDAVRAAVTGNSLLAEALFRQRIQQHLIDRRTLAQRRAFVARAIQAADRRVLAEITQVNRDNARRKIHVNAAQLIRANRLKDQRAKRAAAAAAARQFDLLVATNAQATAANPLLARAQRPGAVGYFRFTYYEQYEDQLRPLEIQPGGTPVTSTNGSAVRAGGAAGGGTQRVGTDCVFPSRTTITNASYPLARRLVLYTTTRSLRRPEVQTFLRYFLLQAQAAATANALVPITDQQRDAGITAVTGRAPTKAPAPAGRATSTTAAQPTTTTSTAPAAAPGAVPGVAPASVGAANTLNAQGTATTTTTK
jgi:ABC-type phosphate transport system substrate-binding protein